MKNIFVILTLLFVYAFANAQFENDVEFVWGNWGAGTNAEGKLKNFIVDEASKNQFVLHKTGSKSYVSIVDESNEYVTNKVFEVEKDGKFDLMHDIFLMGGKLYLLTSRYDAVPFTVFVYAQEIDKDNLEPKGEPKLLMARKENFVKDGPEYKDTRYNLKFSKDGSHMMMLHSPGMIDNWKFRGKKEATKKDYSFAVFNENLEEIYTQNELRFGDYRFVREILLDDDGWLYTLSFKGPNAEKAALLTSFDETGDMAWRDTIKFGQFLKADYHIESGTDQLSVFTFYSSSKTKELYYGMHTSVYNNEDGSKIYTTNNKFEKALMDKFKNRNTRILPGAKIDEAARDITLGGYNIIMVGASFKGKVLIAEKTSDYYKVDEDVPSGKIKGDILVLKMKNDWSYEFGVRIPRHQYSTAERNFNRMSMAYINNANTLHIFFNDSPDNYKKTKAPMREVYNADQNGGCLVHYEIDMRDGSVLHEYPIHTNKDKSVVTYPGLFKELGTDRLKIYGEVGKFKIGEMIVH